MYSIFLCPVRRNFHIMRRECLGYPRNSDGGMRYRFIKVSEVPFATRSEAQDYIGTL